MVWHREFFLVAVLLAAIAARAERHLPRSDDPAPVPAPIVAEPLAATAVRDVSADLAPIVSEHKVPAMAAVVIREGRTVAQGVTGVRRAGDETRATIDDRWHLGSCTKSMTATMCAILVERGTLRWESTLAEVFADLEAGMHEDFRTVTLAQLLTNRGGVPADLKFDGLWSQLWHFTGTPVEARRLLTEKVVSRAPEYKPGTKSVYSNGGFAIAGHMAETAAGKPYEVLMRELLFEPLGMTTCGWGPPGLGPDGTVSAPAGTPPDQPRGHRRDGQPVEPALVGADNPAAISPAGRLHCSIGDWARYVGLHCRAGKSNPDRTPRLLQPETFDRLHTPPDDLSDYAYGWGRPQRAWAGPEGDRFVLTHGGSNTMWMCVTWIAPRRDFAVLVCCNSGVEGAGKACDDACRAMIRALLPTDAPGGEPRSR